mmetsp:Transcript_40538/g.93921  ORF Transcript_40538/g.93921 Transcript_40538/m.93921 type:complete len:203 (-) Transcript_40538:1669-2277(-)
MIRGQLSESYCFADIVNDSSLSKSNITCGAKIGLYKMALRSTFESLWSDLASENSCGLFFLKLNWASRKLLDGHTIVTAPFVSHSSAKIDGSIATAMNAQGGLVFTDPKTGKIISRINGRSPVDYLVSVADVAAPLFKNAGVRFNEAVASGFEIAHNNFDPANPMEDLVFELISGGARRARSRHIWMSTTTCSSTTSTTSLR